jgi:hypothetical protein
MSHPMALRRRLLTLAILTALVPGPDAHAQEPAPPPPPQAPAPPRIEVTQLTLRLEPLQGQATAIAVDPAEDTVTIMTAAHFLSPDDVGKTILLAQESRMSGQLTAVARNPHFRTVRSRTTNEESAFGTLGVDTAIATIRVNVPDQATRRAFDRIKVAELAGSPTPSRGDQILTVHIVDQEGKEHVVRAGNHLNPKCLAWGRAGYDTRRGDSGAGVFLVRKSPEGTPRPILIGNVSQTDDRGGIATLTNRAEPWIAKAIPQGQ